MPFCNRRKILERQDGVAMAVRADNIDFLSSIIKYLRKIHDLPKLILKIKKVVHGPLNLILFRLVLQC